MREGFDRRTPNPIEEYNYSNRQREKTDMAGNFNLMFNHGLLNDAGKHAQKPYFEDGFTWTNLRRPSIEQRYALFPELNEFNSINFGDALAVDHGELMADDEMKRLAFRAKYDPQAAKLVAKMQQEQDKRLAVDKVGRNTTARPTRIAQTTGPSRLNFIDDTAVTKRPIAGLRIKSQPDKQVAMTIPLGITGATALGKQLVDYFSMPKEVQRALLPVTLATLGSAGLSTLDLASKGQMAYDALSDMYGRLASVEQPQSDFDGDELADYYMNTYNKR